MSIVVVAIGVQKERCRHSLEHHASLLGKLLHGSVNTNLPHYNQKRYNQPWIREKRGGSINNIEWNTSFSTKSSWKTASPSWCLSMAILIWGQYLQSASQLIPFNHQRRALNLPHFAAPVLQAITTPRNAQKFHEDSTRRLPTCLKQIFGLLREVMDGTYWTEAADPPLDMWINTETATLEKRFINAPLCSLPELTAQQVWRLGACNNATLKNQTKGEKKVIFTQPIVHLIFSVQTWRKQIHLLHEIPRWVLS